MADGTQRSLAELHMKLYLKGPIYEHKDQRKVVNHLDKFIYKKINC